MDEMITLAELNKLPHIDCDDLNGRIFPLHAYHDDAGDWHLWIPANGKLMPIAGKPVESCYFAKQAASDEDLRFVFLEFIHQRALWPDVGRLAGGIYADVYNLAASLAKVELLFNHSVTIHPRQTPRRLVGSRRRNGKSGGGAHGRRNGSGMGCSRGRLDPRWQRRTERPLAALTVVRMASRWVRSQGHGRRDGIRGCTSRGQRVS
jgi:hypothetical protein